MSIGSVLDRTRSPAASLSFTDSGSKPFGNIRGLVMEYSGVVGEELSKMPSLLEAVRTNRADFILKRLSKKGSGAPRMHTREEALAYGNSLYAKYKVDSCAFALFMEHNIPIADYVREVYAPLLPTVTALTRKNAALVHAFRNLPGEIEKRIILSASPNSYITTALQAQGLREEIDAILALEELVEKTGQAKPHPDAIEAAVDMLKMRPSEIAVVDTDVMNLTYAWEARLTTIHIRPDASAEKSPFVDQSFTSLSAALRWMARKQ